MTAWPFKGMCAFSLAAGITKYSIPQLVYWEMYV